MKNKQKIPGSRKLLEEVGKIQDLIDITKLRIHELSKDIENLEISENSLNSVLANADKNKQEDRNSIFDAQTQHEMFLDRLAEKLGKIRETLQPVLTLVRKNQREVKKELDIAQQQNIGLSGMQNLGN